MSAATSLPLYGFDPDQLATNVIQWFAKSVARRAMQRDPSVNAVLFAVARIVRDGKTRCEYAFVLSEDANITWPFASSPKQNAMLADGRSQRTVTQSIRDLYGADSVDLQHDEGGAFYRAFARFARDPRPADAPLSSAFAPIVSLGRRVYEAGSWEARRADFGLTTTYLATMLSPECEEPRPKPTSNDPREYLSPLEIIETIQQGAEVRYSIDRMTTVRDLLDRYRAEPNAANLQALRESLGLREARQEVSEDAL
jgi:hypothetical protein